MNRLTLSAIVMVAALATSAFAQKPTPKGKTSHHTARHAGKHVAKHVAPKAAAAPKAPAKK